MEFIAANKTLITMALLVLSEGLSLIPSLKGNGIIDTLVKGLVSYLKDNGVLK